MKKRTQKINLISCWYDWCYLLEYYQIGLVMEKMNAQFLTRNQRIGSTAFPIIFFPVKPVSLITRP